MTKPTPDLLERLDWWIERLERSPVPADLTLRHLLLDTSDEIKELREKLAELVAR